jgi:hypothetical protein
MAFLNTNARRRSGRNIPAGPKEPITFLFVEKCAAAAAGHLLKIAAISPANPLSNPEKPWVSP